MTDEPEVLFEKRGCAGIVTLNRPKALNALTLEMVRAMHPQLIDWANDPDVAHVLVRGAGEKAFCAGGDIRKLHDWGKANDPIAQTFYAEEYRLNAYIKAYPKPYVALIDGIDMGGGVGVSVHGSHRVAGSKMMFAMPETGIGFFPDVGGTYFMPRLPGHIGTWMALSGARLGQADAVWAGIATHAVASEKFEALTEALCENSNVRATLDSFSEEPTGETLPGLQTVIDRCFSAGSVEEILERLDAESDFDREWAAKAAATIRKKSPTSLKIALRQMQLGAEADFEACMRIEARVVRRVFEGHDFFEGVRAVIIDKDNAPKWQPDSLAGVSDADIDAYFAPLGDDELDLSGLDTR